MHRVPLLFVVLWLAFAPAPFPRRPAPRGPDKSALGALQGVWVRTSITVGGVVGDEAAAHAVVTVRRGRLEFGPDETWEVEVGQARGGGAIDLARLRPDGSIAERQVGVYRVRDSTLTICGRVGSREENRPTGFDPSQPGVWLAVYKRKGR